MEKLILCPKCLGKQVLEILSLVSDDTDFDMNVNPSNYYPSDVDFDEIQDLQTSYFCGECKHQFLPKDAKFETINISTKDKIEMMNKVGVDIINKIHPLVHFRDGELKAQLQIGHPKESDSISGCYPTHLIQAVISLHEYYLSLNYSPETEKAIFFLKEALNCLNQRTKNRQERGVLHTDKK